MAGKNLGKAHLENGAMMSEIMSDSGRMLFAVALSDTVLQTNSHISLRSYSKGRLQEFYSHCDRFFFI